MDGHLGEELITLGVLFLIAYVLGRLGKLIGLPTIPIYMLVGLIASPNFQLFPLSFESDYVALIAVFGLLLLLFNLGLEFDQDEFFGNAGKMLLSGGSYVLVNLSVGFGFGMLVGWGTREALVIAGMTATSSSAIVTKLLIELRRLANPETPMILGVTVVEDIFIAIYLAIVSVVLSGESDFWAVVLKLLVAFLFLNYADKAVLAFAGTQIQAELGISPAQFGLVQSAFFWLFAAGALFFGALSRRVSIRWLLAGLMFVWVATMAPLLGTTTFAVLLLSRIVLGFAEGPAYALATHAVHGWFPADKRALPAGLVTAGASVGPLICAPVLTWIIVTFDWHVAFAVLMVAGTAWAALWLLLARESAQPPTPEAVAASPESESAVSYWTLLRTGTGGPGSVFAALIFLPVLTLAAQRGRRGVVIATVGVVAVVFPPVVFEPATFTVQTVARAIVVALVALLQAVVAHEATERLRARNAALDRLRVHQDELLDIVRRDAEVIARVAGERESALEQLVSVIDSATEQAIIATDSAGVVQVFNAGAERLLGFAQGEVVGRANLTRLHEPAELAER